MLHALSPARDDAAERKSYRLTALDGTVEDFSVFEGAMVVNQNGARSTGLLTCATLQVFDTYARGQHLYLGWRGCNGMKGAKADKEWE